MNRRNNSTPKGCTAESRVRIHPPARLPTGTGGGERDRTDDLLLAKQALYQLSYTPKGALTGTVVEHGGPG